MKYMRLMGWQLQRVVSPLFDTAIEDDAKEAAFLAQNRGYADPENPRYLRCSLTTTVAILLIG